MNDEAKIQQVCNLLDGYVCNCGTNPHSEFHWFHQHHKSRLASLCRICDADLILEYGAVETFPGFINLNLWPTEAINKLHERIHANR